MESGKLVDQIQVVFRIVTILQADCYKASQLSELTGLQQRTLHSYINKIEELGFVVDKDFQGRFFINNEVVPDFLKAYLKTAA